MPLELYRENTVPLFRIRQTPRVASPWAARLACALCWLTGFSYAALVDAQELQITNASLTTNDGVYLLNAQLGVALPDGARRAIQEGVALTLELEVDLQRARRFWFDDSVASIEQEYELSYHALSENYVLRNINSGAQSVHRTLDAALQAMSVIRDLPVIDRLLLEPDERYAMRVRAALDVRTLPDTLRFVLFWTDDWRQRSEWFYWALK